VRPDISPKAYCSELFLAGSWKIRSLRAKEFGNRVFEGLGQLS
jgi:hypothetical protein